MCILKHSCCQWCYSSLSQPNVNIEFKVSMHRILIKNIHDLAILNTLFLFYYQCIARTQLYFAFFIFVPTKLKVKSNIFLQMLPKASLNASVNVWPWEITADCFHSLHDCESFKLLLDLRHIHTYV